MKTIRVTEETQRKGKVFVRKLTVTKMMVELKRINRGKNEEGKSDRILKIGTRILLVSWLKDVVEVGWVLV